MFKSVKTYTHAMGLSTCFRQWRAKSHCQYLHGYALQIEIAFSAEILDERGWVVDFGGMEQIKQFLVNTFDHKTLVALDDPKLDSILQLKQKGLAQVVTVTDVGCEAFTELIYRFTKTWVDKNYGDRVKVSSVTVREHGGNAAVYEAD